MSSVIYYCLCAEQNFTSVKQRLCGHVGWMCVNFPLHNSNVCNELTCPLVADQQYNLTLTIPVKKSYPTVGSAQGLHFLAHYHNFVLCRWQLWPNGDYILVAPWKDVWKLWPSSLGVQHTHQKQNQCRTVFEHVKHFLHVFLNSHHYRCLPFISCH